MHGHAHAPAARADGRVCTPENRGCASFKRAGNAFDVCDYGFDGDAVAVQRSDGRIVAVRVCLARNAKPGGKPIRLEKFFCSGFQADLY